MISPFIATNMAVVHYNKIGKEYFTRQMVAIAVSRIESIKPFNDQIDGEDVIEIFMASGDTILVFATVPELLQTMSEAVRMATP